MRLLWKWTRKNAGCLLRFALTSLRCCPNTTKPTVNGLPTAPVVSLDPNPADTTNVLTAAAALTAAAERAAAVDAAFVDAGEARVDDGGCELELQ